MLDARGDANERLKMKLLGAQRMYGLASLGLFSAGTLTWRVRSSGALLDNPVDSAAALRLAFDGLALGVVLLGFLSEHEISRRWSRAPLPNVPAFMFSLYVLVVFLGSFAAVAPSLVVFRALELGIALLVASGVARWFSLIQVLALCRALIASLGLWAVLTALAVPSRGFPPARGGLVPFRLEGIFPLFSANGIGFLGTTLFALSLPSEHFRRSGIVLGISLVMLSQYRTGYVALVVCYLVYLWFRAGARRILVLFAPLVALWFVGTAVFQSMWIRGEQASQSASTLSGRTFWWEAALDASQRSPAIGLGLTTGTRFEVLNVLGYSETSSIHGTWVEVYVGTGLIGSLFFLLFVFSGIKSAMAVRAVTLAPLLAVTIALVRSFTGVTLELPGLVQVITLTIILSAAYTVRMESLSRGGVLKSPLDDALQAPPGRQQQLGSWLTPVGPV